MSQRQIEVGTDYIPKHATKDEDHKEVNRQKKRLNRQNGDAGRTQRRATSRSRQIGCKGFVFAGLTAAPARRVGNFTRIKRKRRRVNRQKNMK